LYRFFFDVVFFGQKQQSWLSGISILRSVS